MQPDDVIHVSPAGPQVGLRGSVNKQAVYELRPSESLNDLIRMAGGFTPVADRTRVALERLDNRNAQRVVQLQLQLPEQDAAALVNGDVIRVFSAVDSGLSVQRQNKRVRVDHRQVVDFIECAKDPGEQGIWCRTRGASCPQVAR